MSSIETVDTIEAVSAEWITPEKATEYLGYNTHNRPLRSRVVSAYAVDMANGDWQWNGESIKFAEDGTLLDGQHRLAAIAEAGVPVRMLVVRGLPRTTQDTVDGGTKRNFADVLKLRGEVQCAQLAATVRAVHLWENGSSGLGDTGRAATNAQLLHTLEKYPWLRDGMAVVNRVQAATGMPSRVSGLAWFLFTQINVDDAEHFFDRLASPEGHQHGDPIFALRKLMLQDQDKRGTRNVRFITAVTIKAWNDFRDGARREVLNFRMGGARPEVFPVPH